MNTTPLTPQTPSTRTSIVPYLAFAIGLLAIGMSIFSFCYRRDEYRKLQEEALKNTPIIVSTYSEEIKSSDGFATVTWVSQDGRAAIMLNGRLYHPFSWGDLDSKIKIIRAQAGQILKKNDHVRVTAIYEVETLHDGRRRGILPVVWELMPIKP